MKGQWKVVLAILVLILVVTFAIQNTATAEVDFIFYQTQVPLVLVILFSVLVGAIVGLIGSMTAITRNNKKNKELQKEVNRLKDERNTLTLSKDKTIADLKAQIKDIESKQHNTTIIPQTQYNGDTTEDLIDAKDPLI
ncbi:LapA family protein [Hutsoniella sourekii]|uniref:LapA family protein n=1 Tax=Hutsoniella sourekii TaxID=87650 RepID=UPI0004891297|nr:LapA family protein [Hutsoniella sourekii]